MYFTPDSANYKQLLFLNNKVTLLSVPLLITTSKKAKMNSKFNFKY